MQRSKDRNYQFWEQVEVYKKDKVLDPSKTYGPSDDLSVNISMDSCYFWLESVAVLH